MTASEAQTQGKTWDPPTARRLGTFGSIMRGSSGAVADSSALHPTKPA